MSQNCRQIGCEEDASQSVQPLGNLFEICSPCSSVEWTVGGSSLACTLS